MLRQVYIIKDSKFLYERFIGKGINRDALNQFFSELKQDLLLGTADKIGNHVYYKYRI